MADRISSEAEQNHHTDSKPRREQIFQSSLCLCVSVAIMSIAIPLWAQQSRIYRDGSAWVEEITGTLPPARDLHISTDLGSVQVQGNSPHISYVIRKRSYAPNPEAAHRQFDQMRISAGKNNDGDSIEGRASKNLQHFGVEFVVQVPRDMNLVKVDTRSGSLTFGSIAGTILATTGGGSIRLDDLAGPVKISSGGGDVEAGNLGGNLSLTSGAADVHVNNVAGEMQVSLGGGRVNVGSTRASVIQTGAGSIQVQKCFGDLHVSSGGGNLNLGEVDGGVVAETDGGSVRLASARGPVTVKTGGGSVELYHLGRGAQVETGAGPITVEFVGAHGFADSFLHTAAGDVTVCFSSSLPVTVHATSDMASGHGILSDFPGLNISRQGGNMVPVSMSAEGALNGGGPALRIRTTIGQIVFRRCQ
jgi:hypothetical protein